MSRSAEIAILFHSLIGLCAGGLFGVRHGILPAFLFASIGCASGFVAGLLVSRVPAAVRLIRTNIPSRHRWLAMVYAIFGVLLGIVFWTVCAECAGF